MPVSKLIPDWRDVVDRAVDSRAAVLLGLRRHLHAHPEPSREEYETTALIARTLGAEGIAYRVPSTGRGLIVGPEVPGPLVAVRADIDALRIRDEKDVPYRSKREGLMHACGHDAHATMAVGAAMALHDLGRLSGVSLPWRVVFQPAEEEGTGAAEMIGAGAMQDVRAIAALHVDPERPVGEVGWRIGPLTACCDEIHVVVHGQGGHAARPHLAIDPIAAAAQFVTTAYQTVPRSIDAREPVVVTFGMITGGAQANVIPDRVVLRGTIRTFSRAVSDRVEAQLRAVADGFAALTGARFELSILRGPDAVVNDPAITAAVMQEASRVLGEKHVREIGLPSLGGEDFSAYLTEAPGCLVRIGVASPGVKPWPSLHSPQFDIDERVLTLGARILARSAIALSSGA